MSKTYGNVIGPLVVMDALGTDALRFSLLVGSTPGSDMNLSMNRVDANRNFANKIWNAGRFVIGMLEHAPAKADAVPDWTLADSWIWARLQALIREVERLFQNYQYGEAGRQIYEFFWGEYADWYVEIAKLQLAQKGDRAYYTISSLVKVLELCLRMLHPFTPYVTEEIWGHLKQAMRESNLKELATDWPEALIISNWPEPRQEEGWETSVITDFTLVQEIIRAIRNLRASKDVPHSKLIAAQISAGENLELILGQEKVIAALARLVAKQLDIHQDIPEKPENAVALVIGGVEIYLPLAGFVDRDAEHQRLMKALIETQQQIERLEKLLNGDFALRAPEAVVQKERDKLAGLYETADKLRNQM